MKHRGPLDGWASWFLVLAAAVPAAATTRLGWVVLDGSLDDVFGSQNPPVTGVDLLGIRWSNLWMNSTIPLLLLTGLVVLVVLAALVVAGRPRRLVPVGNARSAAVLVAGFTALLGLVGLVGFAAQFAGLFPISMWSGPTGSPVDAFAPDVAALFAAAVLGTAATVVLAQHTDDVVDDREDHGADGGEGDVGTTSETVDEVVVPQTVPAGPPTVPATDLEHYRRR